MSPTTDQTQPPPPAMEAQLYALEQSLSRMQEESHQLYLKLGKSMVAMHKEREATTLDILQKVNDLASNGLSDHSVEPCTTTARDRRPLFVTPAPPMPTFREDTKHPVHYVEELETYFKKIDAPEENKLDIVYESLSEELQDWAAIYQVAWENYDDFKTDFLRTYWSLAEQEKLRQQISTSRWSWKNSKSMESHFAHYIGLARLLTNPIPEANLVSKLMAHFPRNIQSLWSLKENKSIKTAAEFLRLQGDILAQTYPIYSNNPPPLPSTQPPNKRYRWDKRDNNNIEVERP